MIDVYTLPIKFLLGLLKSFDVFLFPLVSRITVRFVLLFLFKVFIYLILSSLVID